MKRMFIILVLVVVGSISTAQRDAENFYGSRQEYAGEGCIGPVGFC